MGLVTYYKRIRLMGKAQRAVINRDFDRAKSLMDQVLQLPIPGYFETNVHYQAGEADCYAGHYDSALAHFRIVKAAIDSNQRKSKPKDRWYEERVEKFISYCEAQKT